jgi:uncharacterized protein (UPF0303 family)
MGLSEDLERVALQERKLRLPRLDAQVAWNLGMRLKTLADRRGLSVAIAVQCFGHRLFYAALAGVTSDDAEAVRRKSNVVARFYRSSYSVGLALKAKGETLLETYGLPATDYAAQGGSFPLSVARTSMVGSVTVSGLPQRHNHELVVEALCAMLGYDYAAVRLQAEVKRSCRLTGIVESESRHFARHDARLPFPSRTPESPWGYPGVMCDDAGVPARIRQQSVPIALHANPVSLSM